ncbi:MAG: hypothetical protein ACI9F9_002172 [Candidatus Paceibacteria bacterium]|jgi:uncharacterized protein (DUF1800 family)
MNGSRKQASPYPISSVLQPSLGKFPNFQLRPPGDTNQAKLNLRAQGMGSQSVPGASQAGIGGPDVRFLLHHGTMGFSVPDYTEALKLGWSAWLEQQLDPSSINDSEVDANLSLLQTLEMSSSQLLATYPGEFVNQVVIELQIAVLLRAVYSKRQLYERMVTFWTDHFNVSQLDDLCLWTKTVDDREVARAHALGTFPELLKASARSPAMLWYLDNYANGVGAAQENYARELMELHTLGVDGPYNENDVKEVARCFTGWTIAGIGGPGIPGEFSFSPQVHDTGEKTVLGVTIPAGGGITDGERVLEILSTHPKTAEFISRKVCRWLLMYDPPVDLVRKVTTVYLHTGGEIKQMIRAILDPDVVARIPVEQRTKFRQPLHTVIALLRAAQISSTDLLQITFDSQLIGQTPYWWPTPDGPPDSLAKWGGSVLPRWEFASRLFAGQINGNIPSTQVLNELLLSAPGATTSAERINWLLTGGLLQDQDMDQVQAYLDAQPTLSQHVLREALALAASSPSFQFI